MTAPGCPFDHAAIEQEIADLRADVEMWKALAGRNAERIAHVATRRCDCAASAPAQAITYHGGDPVHLHNCIWESGHVSPHKCWSCGESWAPDA